MQQYYHFSNRYSALLVAPFYLYTVGLWVAIMVVVGAAPATVNRPVTCYITAVIKSASETTALVSERASFPFWSYFIPSGR